MKVLQHTPKTMLTVMMFSKITYAIPKQSPNPNSIGFLLYFVKVKGCTLLETSQKPGPRAGGLREGRGGTDHHRQSPHVLLLACRKFLGAV